MISQLQKGECFYLGPYADRIYIKGESDDKIKPALEAMLYYSVPNRGLRYNGSHSAARGDKITTRSFKLIAKMTWLKDLTISRTGVIDDDLAILANISQLESLGLSKTAISDAGLKHLVSMKSLETVYVYETKVTSDGLEWLMRQIPSLNNEDMQEQLQNMRELEKQAANNKGLQKESVPSPSK